MRHKIFASYFAAAAIALLGLSGCTQEEIIDTNQLSKDGVVFSGFAPNPVARGGVLRLYGSNLQKASEVQIQGVDPITDIEVITSGPVSEIHVTVPVDGPEIGRVSVVADGKTFTSKTDLEYSEPIIFESFSPASAMPGDIITIKGDYLNNIREVIFEGNAYVTEFEEQSRYELKVKVPAKAITGQFIIGDVNELDNADGAVANLFYAPSDLSIGDPTVASTDRGTVKAGGEIKVTGKHLEMIASLAFGEVSSDFTVAEDGQSLETTLPDTAIDGELVLTSYAGKAFKAGEYKTLVPSEITVTADTRFKAGLAAKIAGKDLDLVKSATLGGVAIELDGNYAFTIPANAPDGVVTLTLANGKTVDSDAIELVKPTITDVSPLDLYAGDGNVTVTGTDLDLVASASIGGKEETIAEGATETKLEIETTASSLSGKVALSLANGAKVESEAVVALKYHSLVVVESMTAAQHIGEEVVLKGTNFDLVENIFIGDVKVTKYSLRTSTEVKFLMPWVKAGSYSIKFSLFSGDEETLATPIEVQLERLFTTIWEGSEHIAWSGMQELAWGGYDFKGLKPGTILIAHYTLDADQDYWQMRFGNGSWNSLPSGISAASSLDQSDGNIPLTEGSTYYALTLTAEDIAMLNNDGGLVMTGTNYTLTKVELVSEISQEKTIWEGSADPQGWAVSPELGGDDCSDWINAGLTVGQVIKIYCTCSDPSDWAVQIFGPHWGDMLCEKISNENWDISVGYVQLEVTESILENLTTQAGWGKSIILQGNNVIFTSITLL